VVTLKIFNVQVSACYKTVDFPHNSQMDRTSCLVVGTFIQIFFDWKLRY